MFSSILRIKMLMRCERETGGGMGGRERESGGRGREGARGDGRVGGRGRENARMPRPAPPKVPTHKHILYTHTQVDRILQRQKEKKDKRIARLKKLGDFMLVDS
jgi:hypothetical protein